MIDTHCHMYAEEFDSDRAEALNRCLQAGIDTLLLPAIDPQSHERQQSLADSHSADLKVFQMMGLHPTSVKEDWEEQLAITHDRLFADPQAYVAIGEIGLDYYWDRTFEKEQIEVLKRQETWSAELSLPMCLHVRKAYEEILGLFKQINRGSYRGVMHCFGGSLNQAQRSIEMGFVLGIGGVVTFKNAGMAEVVREVSLDKIILETDAPYLAPVPYRGKRNESAYIVDIARKIAEIKGVSLEEVAETTTHTARTLFRLP